MTTNDDITPALSPAEWDEALRSAGATAALLRRHAQAAADAEGGAEGGGAAGTAELSSHLRAAVALANPRTSAAGESMDSFGARATLRVGDRAYEMFRLDALEREGGRRRPAADGVAVTGTTSSRSPAGPRARRRRARSPSAPPARYCRTSPACRRSSTSPRCATRWPR